MIIDNNVMNTLVGVAAISVTIITYFLNSSKKANEAMQAVMKEMSLDLRHVLVKMAKNEEQHLALISEHNHTVELLKKIDNRVHILEQGK